jgi:dTDP-4-dehydrorhamnose reductase
MNILLLGASGMLGFTLHRKLHDAGFDITGSIRSVAVDERWTGGLKYVSGVDIADFDTVAAALKRYVPDVVINATGVHSLGAVNGDWSELLAVNSVFPTRLGQLCESRGIRFVHFSSDGVFSGARGMYAEADLPDATDAYGISKYLGEVRTSTALVIRTSMLGRGIVDNRSIVDWYLAQSGTVRGYRRAVFSGLPVNEIANVLTRVLSLPTPLTGLYHLAAAPISKFDILTLVRTTWSHVAMIEPDDSLVIDRSLDGRELNEKIGYKSPEWPQLIADMYAFYKGLGRNGLGLSRQLGG